MALSFYHGRIGPPGVKSCNEASCPALVAPRPGRPIFGGVNRSAAIVLNGCVKRYGSRLALDGMAFSVGTGSCYALLGSNGAGKTTTVRLISTLIRADAGSIEVAGLDVSRFPHRVRELIGVVPDFPALFEPLTPRENALQIARLRRIDLREANQRIVELAAALALEAHLDLPVTQLSHGTRKKATLLVAMLHAPRVLILDEPFEGVDPVATIAIRELLERLRQRGVTIFLTSHVLPLVETMATDVAVIDRGRLLAAGPIEQVVADHGSLESAFQTLVGGAAATAELAWYQP